MTEQCYYQTTLCDGRLWTCRTCQQRFCETHTHTTSKGLNLECVACEKARLEQENEIDIITLPVGDIEICVSAGGCAGVTCPLLDGMQETHESLDEVYALEYAKGQRDALYSMLLAHAVAGINMLDPNYLKGVQAVFDSIVNSL